MLKFPEIELNGAYNIITGKIFTGGCIFPATHNSWKRMRVMPRFPHRANGRRTRKSIGHHRENFAIILSDHVTLIIIESPIEFPRCTARHKILRETFHELCLSRRDIEIDRVIIL